MFNYPNCIQTEYIVESTNSILTYLPLLFLSFFGPKIRARMKIIFLDILKVANGSRLLCFNEKNSYVLGKKNLIPYSQLQVLLI